MLLYAKSVPVLVPGDPLFGCYYPECLNTISPNYATALLTYPDKTNDPDLVVLDPETTENRNKLVKLLFGADGLYATPYFAGGSVGRWTPGGAYILLPLDDIPAFGYGYEFTVRNTVVPLHDFWEEPEESSDEISDININESDDNDTLPY